MKSIIGTVTSLKMDKTAVVEVIRRWAHPIYKKTITRRKKFLAQNDLKLTLGDRVKIQACKPISRLKKWQVIKKI